jgi:hypothetical protein
MIVLLGRTPCLLVMAMVPATWMTSVSVLSMNSRKSVALVAVTTRPPAPPVVPF